MFVVMLSEITVRNPMSLWLMCTEREGGSQRT